MLSNPHKRNEHVAAVQDYEAKVNASANGRISRNDLAPTRTVSAVSSDMIRLTTPLGVFWPESIYKAKTKSEIPASKLCWSKGVRGIIRDASLGCDKGCWHVEHVSSHGVQDTTGLLSKETAMRDGQLDDVYQRAASSLTFGVKRKEVDDAEDGEILMLGSSQKPATKKQLRAQPSDGGSSGDWLSAAVTAPLKCAAVTSPDPKTKAPAVRSKKGSRAVTTEHPMPDSANGSTDGGQAMSGAASSGPSTANTRPPRPRQSKPAQPKPAAKALPRQSKQQLQKHLQQVVAAECVAHEAAAMVELAKTSKGFKSLDIKKAECDSETEIAHPESKGQNVVTALRSHLLNCLI